MSKTPHSSGRFVWHELVTPDPKAASGFYGEMFGWKARPMDMGGHPYTIWQSGDLDVGGATTPPKGSQVPPSWLSYCTVPDVDTATAKATSLGAKVMAPPMDLPNVGRFSVIVDAQGAALAPFKQVEERPEPSGLPSVGSFCWDELLTSDPEKVLDFYRQVYGWTSDANDMGPMGTYHVLKRGELRAGGIMKSPMAEMPSMWLAYVAVDDVDAKTKQAEKLQGKIVAPAREIPGIGRFSVVADAQGAMVALFKGVG